MAQGYFLTGTDTDVGKTHVAVQLIERWRRDGRRVLAMKPVASGCERTADGTLVNGDVERLAAATGQRDRALMNPYRFEPAISPHFAARDARVDIDLARLLDHYRTLAGQADIVLVEGAGGWLAPLSDSLDIADLAVALKLPVMLVVGMRLGCINHARLSAQAILDRGLPLAGWIANRIDPDMARYEDNLATLKAKIAAPLLLEVPYHAP